MQDTTSSLFSSAKRFLSGTVLSRLTGLVRDIIMAFAFGTQSSVAAFLLAFRFSHLFRRLLGEGTLQTAFVPAFEKLRKDSPERAAFFFRDLYICLSALLALLVFGVMAILFFLLLWGGLSAGNREVAWLTLLMMPSLFFICLYGLNAGLLQCEKSFFTASVAPAGFNFLWITGIILLWKLPAQEAMPWLSLFIILACMAQWMVTIPKTYRILHSLGMEKPWQRMRLISPDVVLLFVPLLLGIVGMGASQINNALDSIFARYADESGPALLWYAIRIQQLPLALFGIAISGALLPPLSRAIKSQDLVRYRHFLDFALCRSMAPMLPMTFAFFILGDSGINLIYGHGLFDDASTVNTTLCLWAYGVGLVPMTVVLILAPALYAQGDYKTTTKASLLAMLLNCLLNGILIFFFGLGAASVALATSVSAAVNVLLLGNKVKQTIGSIYTPSLHTSLCRVLASCVVAAVAVFVMDSLFLGGNTAWLLFLGQIPSYSHRIADQILRLALQTLCFFSFLALSGWVFKASDLFAYFQKEKWREEFPLKKES